MPQESKMPKGLPKRSRNEKAKARRMRSWLRTQARKKVQRDEVAAREKANRERRVRGEMTPWEVALAKRAERITRG